MLLKKYCTVICRYGFASKIDLETLGLEEFNRGLISFEGPTRVLVGRKGGQTCVWVPVIE